MLLSVLRGREMGWEVRPHQARLQPELKAPELPPTREQGLVYSLKAVDGILP